MFKLWGSQEQQTQARPQDASSQSSWPNSSNHVTPNSGSSSRNNFQRPSDRLHSPSHTSPSEAASVIALLRDQSVDELRKLLSDKEAYQQFLLSLDQVKIQNNIREELRKETMQIARENLEKEPHIMELSNQCRIIRTTELAAAQEKLNELERRKEEVLRSCSPASLLYKLQEAMNKVDEECGALDKQLLEREIELAAFVQKYKKLRTLYHRRALIYLSATTSSVG